jgi:D-sedoheptulose 7-phosphate isomerase
MTFPERPYPSIQSYCDDYFAQVAKASSSLDRGRVEEAAGRLTRAYREGRMVYVAGNGGSAMISDHLVCDHLKCIQTGTDLCPRIVSLSSNVALLTAIANDISFADVFVFPLRTLAKPGDVLVTISSSGDSENVVRALAWAGDNHLETIALTGFSGGRAGALAQTHLHVEGDNYGVIEDVHQSIMHILAQYLRQAGMTADAIASSKF